MSARWPSIRLGDVLTRAERFESRDELTEYHFAGTYSFARGIFPGDHKPGSSFALPRIQRIRQGDFIYCKIMAWEGAFGVAPKAVDGCVMSGAFVVYEIDTSRLDPRFLDWYFKVPSHWRTVGKQSSGTNVRRQSLHPEQFERSEILLPPLAEQRRVVARIEELAGQIEEARALRKQASVDIAYLSRQLLVASFPVGSHSVVGDFISFQTGYAFKSEWFSEVGIRLARNTNIGHGTLDWSETARLPEERRKEFAQFELQLGDILISLDRPIISTGVKVARVDSDDLPSLLLQRVARARFQREEVLPEYFLRWLESPYFMDAIDPGRSNGVPHISHKDIEKIPFFPPTIPDQRRILAQLEALAAQRSELGRLHVDVSGGLDALLPAILHRAFKPASKHGDP